jgi:hypothetical protein
MKILILDDLKIRHDIFAERYQGNELVHCYTYTSLIKELDNQFDIIHLDHDLGEGVQADTYEGYNGNQIAYNGMDVAVEIAKRGFDGQIIIHSLNPEGSRRMRHTIGKAGIKVIWDPFKEYI